MEVIDTSIADVKLIKPKVHTDERGFFMETYKAEWFQANVADVSFVQNNHSRSQVGILRGLHYQLVQPQGKLLRVTQGEIFDVCVDLRVESETFGEWFGTTLSADNRLQLWVPEGFAHGFYTLSESAELQYMCTDYYHPSSEVSIRYDDPYLAINWPINSSLPPLLSSKDKDGLIFSDAPKFTASSSV